MVVAIFALVWIGRRIRVSRKPGTGHLWYYSGQFILAIIFAGIYSVGDERRRSVKPYRHPYCK